jgi:hypothetical protein
MVRMHRGHRLFRLWPAGLHVEFHRYHFWWLSDDSHLHAHLHAHRLTHACSVYQLATSISTAHLLAYCLGPHPHGMRAVRLSVWMRRHIRQHMSQRFCDTALCTNLRRVPERMLFIHQLATNWLRAVAATSWLHRGPDVPIGDV